ncbi:hypothetical protein M378DRAFT_18527 [Amanita muscaria Koide BX008]|uniref:Uncharacterized protein n=1 Tax=Amanita muscaria (strain Koide BX008) TaxID=946122 RepID=A0A0C2SLL2_AMAMK|nr:hypothetical protein M378DRAFT_18527 [Amanita muscaria Koide BX008]
MEEKLTNAATVGSKWVQFWFKRVKVTDDRIVGIEKRPLLNKRLFQAPVILRIDSNRKELWQKRGSAGLVQKLFVDRYSVQQKLHGEGNEVDGTVGECRGGKRTLRQRW